MLTFDLNCDLGEYEDTNAAWHDAKIMDYISSCNIACGGHAGNQHIIKQTVTLALEKQVSIGAHPSFPDRDNFGRSEMQLPAYELKEIIRTQILNVKTAAETQGGKLSHVKPHGALYNQAANDLALAQLLAETIAELDKKLFFYGLAHSAMATACQQCGVNFVAEGFVDRAYQTNGMLVPRSHPGAVISDVHELVKRAIGIIKNQSVISIEGDVTQLVINSLCIHGDHENATQTAQLLQEGLLLAGIVIKAPQLYQKL